MKVMIEAEIEQWPDADYWGVYVKDKLQMCWKLSEDGGEWEAYGTDEDGIEEFAEGGFHSEPAARAWVLEQLAAKEVQRLPIAVYMGDELQAMLQELADAEGYLNGILSWRDKWEAAVVQDIRIATPDGEYQARGDAKDGVVRIEKKEVKP